jgi:hypothetical protein
MPEITDAQMAEYRAYQSVGGTPDQLTKKVGDLEKDNQKQRDEIRGLRDDKKALEAKLPADGAVVLTGDDAAAWPRYAKLGKPDELEGAVTERDTLKKDAAARAWEDRVKAAAEAEGWGGKPGILKLALRGLEDHVLEVRDEKGDKGEAKVAYIKEPGEGKSARKLRDFLKDREPEVLEALGAAAGQQQRRTGTDGLPFVPQRTGEGNAPDLRTNIEPGAATTIARYAPDYNL